MTKLDLTNPFEFTLRDGVETILKGSLRELTKKEFSEFNSQEGKIKEVVDVSRTNSQEITYLKELFELQKQNDLLKAEETLTKLNTIEKEANEFIKQNNPDELLEGLVKKRIHTCLEGENKAKIIDLAESYGYRVIFNIIQEAINEKKQNSTTA